MIDKSNDKIKKQIKNWWSNHSQDYVDPGKKDHTGVKKNLSDGELTKFLNDNDKNFYEDAYFAQKYGSELFSNLIPKNIKNKKILEIGCGLGSHSEIFAKKKAKLTSIDLAPTSIEITKKRLELKKLKGNIIEADAEKLPFPDNYFDIIWSWGVIHHSPNTKQCAREITRVLSKQGKLYIMLYNKNSLYNWINVILRYGVLKRQLLKMSIQDLHNRYTDGKSDLGAPLSKYFTRDQIKNYLFPKLRIVSQHAYEKKHAFSFWVPPKFRRKFEKLIPDFIYTFLWSRLGFLLFTIAEKNEK